MKKVNKIIHIFRTTNTRFSWQNYQKVDQHLVCFWILIQEFDDNYLEKHDTMAQLTR